MNNAIASGSYADMKIVKTRSVMQVVVEIPIEQANSFIEMFGVPVPGAEIPVAIARLNKQNEVAGAGPLRPQPPKPEAEARDTPRRPFHELPPSQQAALKCNDPDFQQWIGADDAEDAAFRVRRGCQVTSRSELDKYPEAAKRWRHLLDSYEAERRLPERRG